MKSRISGVAIGLAGLVAANGALAAQQWNMATAYRDPLFHTRNILQFVNEIAEASEGELKIAVHSAQSLYKLREIHRAVRSGQIQMGETVVSLLAGEDRVYEVDSLLFLAESYDQARRLWRVSRPFIASRLARKGLTLLYSVPWPPQGFYAKMELKSADDFKRLKFRAYDATISRYAAAVGAVPTTVQLVDIPQAFSTGIVDAMIASATTGVLTRSWDYLTHYHDTRAGLGKNMVIVNTRAFKRLDEGTRKAVLDAAARAEPRGWEMSANETARMTATLAEKLTVVPPRPGLMKGLRAAGARMVEGWLAKTGPDGRKILDAYRASN